MRKHGIIKHIEFKDQDWNWSIRLISVRCRVTHCGALVLSLQLLINFGRLLYQDVLTMCMETATSSAHFNQLHRLLKNRPLLLLNFGSPHLASKSSPRNELSSAFGFLSDMNPHPSVHCNITSFSYLILQPGDTHVLDIITTISCY